LRSPKAIRQPTSQLRREPEVTRRYLPTQTNANKQFIQHLKLFFAGHNQF
jgi:hypothetical protein